jgi:hypothetical protein
MPYYVLRSFQPSGTTRWCQRTWKTLKFDHFPPVCSIKLVFLGRRKCFDPLDVSYRAQRPRKQGYTVRGRSSRACKLFVWRCCATWCCCASRLTTVLDSLHFNELRGCTTEITQLPLFEGYQYRIVKRLWKWLLWREFRFNPAISGSINFA